MKKRRVVDVPDLSEWRDKVCVVTGASSGIGRAVATDLASRGALVCAVARRGEMLAELVRAIGGEGAGHTYVVVDVSNEADVKRLGDHVRSKYGRCDLLVNNAGFSRRASPLEDGAVDALRSVMATNFEGAVLCTQELLTALVESAPSHVVNVASVAGRLAVKGSPAYTASKFALVGWSEAVSYELAVHGVYVSLVEPGLIPTEGFPHEAWRGSRFGRALLGTSEDVAAAVRDAVLARKLQRTVPRWYYLLQVPRLVAPRAFRRLQARVVRPGAHERVSPDPASSK